MIEPTENWISTSRIHGWVGHTCHKWNVPWWVWNGLKASRGRRNHDASGCPSKYRGSNPSAIWVYHVESFKIIRANSEIYGKSEVLTPTNSVVSTISAPWDSPWQSLPRAMCGSIPWRKNLLVLNKRRVAGWVAGGCWDYYWWRWHGSFPKIPYVQHQWDKTFYARIGKNLGFWFKSQRFNSSTKNRQLWSEKMSWSLIQWLDILRTGIDGHRNSWFTQL